MITWMGRQRDTGDAPASPNGDHGPVRAAAGPGRLRMITERGEQRDTSDARRSPTGDQGAVAHAADRAAAA